MSDQDAEGFTDEQRAKVRDVLLQMLRKHGTDVDDEVQAFEYTFIGEYGTVAVLFDIDTGFFDWALRTSKALMDHRFEAAANELRSKGKLKGEPIISTKGNEEIAGIFAYFAMEGMRGKLKSAFYELGLETEKVFDGLLLSEMEKSGMFTFYEFTPPNIKDEVKALSKSIGDERKRFLIAQIDSLRRKPRFDRMPELYPTLLKVWQSARKIYESNSESETWRDMVKAKYPDLKFDDDLLTRVTGKLTDLSEDLQIKLEETDGDHTPNTIALEHAARMCGAQHYQYGTRHYHNLKGTKTEHNETK